MDLRAPDISGTSRACMLSTRGPRDDGEADVGVPGLGHREQGSEFENEKLAYFEHQRVLRALKLGVAGAEND